MISLNTLKRIPLIASLSEEELSRLAVVLQPKRAKKGSFLVYADEPGSDLLFIVSGQVRITVSSKEGKEAVVGVFSDGDFFGEMALLTGATRSANVIAATECELLALSREDFERHVLSQNGLLLALCRALAMRLRVSTGRIADLSLYDVYRRLARIIRSIGKPSGEEPSQIFVLDPKPTHMELASMVGTSREMVTRAMKSLEDEGCIKIIGKRLELYRLPL